MEYFNDFVKSYTKLPISIDENKKNRESEFLKTHTLIVKNYNDAKDDKMKQKELINLSLLLEFLNNLTKSSDDPKRLFRVAGQQKISVSMKINSFDSKKRSITKASETVRDFLSKTYNLDVIPVIDEIKKEFAKRSKKRKAPSTPAKGNPIEEKQPGEGKEGDDDEQLSPPTGEGKEGDDDDVQDLDEKKIDQGTMNEFLDEKFTETKGDRKIVTTMFVDQFPMMKDDEKKTTDFIDEFLKNNPLSNYKPKKSQLQPPTKVIEKKNDFEVPQGYRLVPVNQTIVKDPVTSQEFEVKPEKLGNRKFADLSLNEMEQFEMGADSLIPYEMEDYRLREIKPEKYVNSMRNRSNPFDERNYLINDYLDRDEPHSVKRMYNQNQLRRHAYLKHLRRKRDRENAFQRLVDEHYHHTHISENDEIPQLHKTFQSEIRLKARRAYN